MEVVTKNQELNLTWPEEGITRVPYQVFLDQKVYDKEQKNIFRGPTWNYLCLEAEIPNKNDYKTGFIGDTPVVVTRSSDGTFNAFVNRCAHRGATVCMDSCGNSRSFTCVYHAWVYDDKGNLKGVPFKNGVNGNGGMPDDFDTKKLSLTKIRVENYHGMLFGTFDENLEPVDQYIGGKMGHYLKRVFNGRPIKILGYQRQKMQNNWKLYFENVKDSYHASLLHLFFTTFGINRLSQKGGIDLDERGMHHVSYTFGNKNENESVYKNEKVRSYSKYTLDDPSLLDGWDEFDDGITLAIQSIFPGVVLQQIHNTLAVRQLLPKSPGECELVWTFIGYEDDTDEQTEMRLKQNNLVGPAGFVSLEDGGIGEMVQKAIVRDGEKTAFIEMGGKDVKSENYRITETSIRGFWKNYRTLMGL